MSGARAGTPPEMPMIVTLADGPAFSIIRGDKLLQATRGVGLVAGDLIETGPGNFIVVSAADGAVVALGSDTFACLPERPEAATWIVLRGWLKEDVPGPAATVHRVIGQALGAASHGSVLVVHASERGDELFQESGVLTLLLRDGLVTTTNRESTVTQFFFARMPIQVNSSASAKARWAACCTSRGRCGSPMRSAWCVTAPSMPPRRR